MHTFDQRRGFGPQEERFGKWITAHAIIAQSGDELRTTAEQFEIMRRGYYAERGWGVPPGR